MKKAEPVECTEVMDLTTQPGAKVIFSYPDNGWPSDIEQVKTYKLKVGKEYTVVKLEVGSYSSHVWLAEFPFRAFNTVQFTNVPVAKPAPKPDPKPKAKVRKKPKIQPYSDMWQRLANSLARSTVEIKPCKHCEMPVLCGYCCQYCESSDP